VADAEPLTAYFTIEELRTHHPELVSETRFTDAKLEADRAYAEQWFEVAARVAYLRRDVVETHVGAGTRSLFLGAHVEVGPVTAVKIDGAEISAGELADLVVHNFGVVERAARWPKGATIEVTYTHGFTEPCELAKQAVMMLAAAKALPSTIPARATALSTDAGSFRISQADKTGKTGIPDVDAIIGLLGDAKPVTG